MSTKSPSIPRGTRLAQPFLEELMGGPLTFGRMLESHRLCDEVSQTAYAAKLGISRSHLNDIEKGRKAVSPARAAHWAEVLGYSTFMFVRLALQDMADRTGLKLRVDVRAA